MFLSTLSAQEIVGMKDIYLDKGRIYKVSDNTLFSGQAQKVRKNGHLVYEDYFENGYIIKTVVYYNGTEEPVTAQLVEYYEKSFDVKKETNYGFHKPFTEIKHFDTNGKKSLVEEYESEKLIYRCEYVNNRKHGIEFCLDKNGEELRIEYRNGKKVKTNWSYKTTTNNPMKPYLIIFLSVFFFSSCAEKEEKIEIAHEPFTSEITALKEFFQIPGLAVAIEQDGALIYENYLGVADMESVLKVDENTLFPIASITKVFSGVLVMKLVEEGKLSLDTPINEFLPEPLLGDSIQVKHVLSHTSQGDVGKEFYYSSRFGLITQVIEKASGQSFADLMEEEIFTPLALQNSFLLQDSTQIAQIAQPYMMDNGLEAGFIDYGYSASAGIVSNLEDLAIFNNALDSNRIISKSSKEIMFTAFDQGLPYGYGIFNQQLEGLDMVWAYGQYDCYSSLFLKIPSENITLTLLANNSLLSDPARLINGDVTSSLFALSFLKNYVLKLEGMPLFETPNSLSRPASNTEFYRRKILAQALAASYMARFDPEKMETSAQVLHHVFTEYPNYLEYGDLNLLHNLAFLKDIAFYMDLGELNDFDTQLEAIGKKLLEQEPNNPYAHSYLGTFYARKANTTKAKYHFEAIVNAPNFSSNWYTREAQQWLDGN